MDRVKYLINWTQESDVSGGTERRYSALQKAFPKATLISATEISGEKYSISKRRIAVDEFLINNTTPEDIVIKDAGVGGLIPIPAKKVLLFGNPYQSMIDHFRTKVDPGHWRKLVDAQVQDAADSDYSIANSNFSVFDAQLSRIQIHVVVLNGVDVDFWHPDKRVKKKYVLWVGSEFKDQYSYLRIDQSMAKIKVPFRKIYKEENLSNEEMLKAYREAFCLVHTFPVEGNSNAVLEALACDIPVVSTRSGLFWDSDISKVGYFWNNNKSKSQTGPIKKILQGHFTGSPRKVIIESGLTESGYITAMREVVKAVL